MVTLTERHQIFHVDAAKKKLPIALLFPRTVDVVNVFRFAGARLALLRNELADRISE